MFPHVRRELRHWRRRAAAIPDPALRRLALETHDAKATHSEGAAAFATLAPPSERREVVRALVALQAMYDYLDTVSEQPGADPYENGRQLHRALIVALDPSASPLDYYAANPVRRDGGYLNELVEACRAVCRLLPSFMSVAEALRRSATRAMESQGLHHAIGRRAPSVTEEMAACWAARQTAPDLGFLWWEVVGAAGSSLGMLALIAAAAEPELAARDVHAIETLYFPWAGALLGLADSLADQLDDAITGDHSFMARYGSPAEAGERIATIGTEALRMTRSVPKGELHAVIIAAMVSFFLTAPGALNEEAREPRDRALEAMGDLAKPAVVVLRTRRTVTRVVSLAERRLSR